MRIIKSPLNYLGNKAKLVDSIKNNIPSEIEVLHDVFCGGGDIFLNISSKKTVANDINSDLISMFKYLQSYDGGIKERLIELEAEHFPMNTYKGKAIRSWQEDKTVYNRLFEDKKSSYYKLRECYNNQDDKDYLILLLLIINSYGLVEFRSVEGYVTYTAGKGRLNRNILAILDEFQGRLKDIVFTNKSFEYLYDVDFKDGDFVYLDPPYLGTSQYKDKWTSFHEEALYDLLNHLDKRGVKFALSNFADSKLHDNKYLSKWMSNYEYINLEDNHRGLLRFGKGERQEILVVNY